MYTPWNSHGYVEFIHCLVSGFHGLPFGAAIHVPMLLPGEYSCDLMSLRLFGIIELAGCLARGSRDFTTDFLHHSGDKSGSGWTNGWPPCR